VGLVVLVDTRLRSECVFMALKVLLLVLMPLTVWFVLEVLEIRRLDSQRAVVILCSPSLERRRRSGRRVLSSLCVCGMVAEAENAPLLSPSPCFPLFDRTESQPERRR
jgi:hypothetical protein